MPNDPLFAFDPANPTDPYQQAFHDPNDPSDPFDTVDQDIDAPEAWDFVSPNNKGSRSVVVAVIDSGIDYLHPDLQDNIWTNPNPTIVNNVTYPAGSHGFDFVNNDSDPMDDNGHGTSVAGVIGATGNNSLGIAGVNWQVSLLPIKYLNRDNVGLRSNAVAAVNYATLLARKVSTFR